MQGKVNVSLYQGNLRNYTFTWYNTSVNVYFYSATCNKTDIDVNH